MVSPGSEREIVSSQPSVGSIWLQKSGSGLVVKEMSPIKSEVNFFFFSFSFFSFTRLYEIYTISSSQQHITILHSHLFLVSVN